MHPASRDAVVVWREAEGSHSADYSDSESRGGGSGIITDLPKSKFKRGAGCVGLIAILIGPFLALWIFSIGYDDIREFIDQFNQPPTPMLVQVIVTATPLPIPTIPATHTPTPTLTPTSVPTVAPSPTSVPTQIPTATATHIPLPTPRPAKHSIEVASENLLSDGQVDFTARVENTGELESEEAAQFQMSIDGGPPELVNIIGSLSAGESKSFAFTRRLTPGTHEITFTVGDSARTISVNVEAEDINATPVPTPTSVGGLVLLIVTATPIATPPPEPTATATTTLTLATLTPTNTPMPTATATLTRVSAQTPVPTNTAMPIPTPETAVSPDLRHLEEKTYMLELINAERAEAGLDPVILGDNIAAQLHAEAALENCFASHWGIDGLKPYMRYSLAGGYQSNGENGSGSDYCIKASDGYRAITNIKTEIRQAMEGWMGSPGHRRNVLGRWHKKVNIGLAWDRYNFLAYQHFEGDYVEYAELPSIKDGVLRISGRTKNGARVSGDRALGVQIYYDQPPHSLTRGQVTRTYCYDGGLQVGALRKPLTGGWYYEEDEFTKSYKPCPDPYDVLVDAPAPRSHNEAHRFWQTAYDASQERQETLLILPWITALEWTTNGDVFTVRANLSSLLDEHSDGVYTVLVWGNLGAEREVISEYSIFYGVIPPDTYKQ